MPKGNEIKDSLICFWPLIAYFLISNTTADFILFIAMLNVLFLLIVLTHLLDIKENLLVYYGSQRSLMFDNNKISFNCRSFTLSLHVTTKLPFMPGYQKKARDKLI